MKRENILPDLNILVDLAGRDVFKWKEKKYNSLQNLLDGFDH